MKTVFTTLAMVLALMITEPVFSQTKTWTGASSTAWNTAANWSPTGVPTAANHVIIPSAPANQPLISGTSTPVCNNLTVNSGATLTISGTSSNNAQLSVAGTATFNGALSIGGVIAKTGKLVAANVIWNSTASISPAYGGRMEISGNWTFASGSSIDMGWCWVTLAGTGNSTITSQSATSMFSSLTINKTGGAVAYIGASSTATLTITGALSLGTGAVLIGQADILTILKGNLINSGNIYMNAGTLSFEKSSGTQEVQINTNDYFNSVRINTGGTVTLSTVYLMQLKGSMNIQAGVLNPNNNIIALFGDWSNTAGPDAFVQGTGRVIFNGGNYHQYCSDETFFTLEVHKTVGGALRMNGSNVTCTKYDWTAGAIDVLNNGTFTVSNQLLDNGIAGNFYLNSGCTINLTNLTGNIDLKGNLYIYGGNFNVYGGVNPSYWPFGGNASITMSGGTLDFIDQGMLIKTDATYSFSHNITGGTIRTAGNFACNRSDFNPTAGLIEMTGSNNVLLSMTAGSLHNLTINKQTTSTVTLSTDATINGLLLMDEGIFKINNKVLTTNGNIAVNAGGTFWLDLNAQLKIAGNKNITVYSGGLLKVIGAAGNEPVITRNGSIGNYIIHVNSGGTIAASRASFYYLNPLRVFSGAAIDPLHPFHYCKFRYTSTGMLRIDNDQDLLIRNVEFLGPATGYNVYKSVDQGNLEFKDSYGDYAGTANENDPYNRIEWTVTQPGLWTGAVSTNWYTADNWDDLNIPTAATNVVIPATASNMPVIDAGEWECNKLNIGGTLTLSGGNLIANGDMTITGTLNMNAPADQLSVFGNVVWESGSQAAITADVVIEVYGHWNFNAGSLAGIDKGKVNFTGNQSKWIRCYSENSYFNSVYVNKTSGSQIGFSDLSTEPLLINDNLRVFANGKFVSDGGVDVVLKGDLISDGITQFNGAALKLAGVSQSLFTTADDYFNHLVFQHSDTVVLHTVGTDTFIINGDVWINSGVVDAFETEIHLKSHWHNNAGPQSFLNDFGRVIFNGGNYHQHCFTDATFNTIEIDKPLGSALRISEGKQVTCTRYDWTAGALDVLTNASFTANDLTDNGIYGSYYVNDGSTINLYQDSGQGVDLNGHLTFNNGGTINIYHDNGGIGDSFWAAGADASITMDGGILDFKEMGIYIPPSAYNLTLNITDGDIRTTGSFTCNKSNFNPSGGLLEFYGTTDANLTMSAGSMNNLTINKEADALVTTASTIDILDEFQIVSGIMELLPNAVVSQFRCNVFENGELRVTEGASMKIYSTGEMVIKGGKLQVLGTPANLASIIGGVADCDHLTIQDGGTISASNAYFSGIFFGLHVSSTGWVDPDYAFTNCTFENGYYQLLRIENSQDLIIHDAHFPSASASNNIVKLLDQGSVTFINASGDFSGPDYENDPYNRIHWSYTQPGLWTGTVSTDWWTSANWDDGNVPNAATDVTIPATASYMPTIGAGIATCKNITINGILTIAAADLNVAQNLAVNGTLAMNNAGAELSVQGEIAWNAGSTANITADAQIHAYGNWNFNAGANANLANGTVFFLGTVNKWIRSYSANCSFFNLRSQKTGGAQIGFSDLSTEDLKINGYLLTYTGSRFVSDSPNDIIVKGNITSQGILQCNYGAMKLDGINQTITPGLNDYFNHFVFSQTGTASIVTTQTNIVNIKGDIHFDSGIFNAGSSIIKVGGNWDNNVGTSAFVEGGSRVIFNGGNYHQYCGNETFNIVEVDKPLGGALRTSNSGVGKTVMCNEYDWTAGALDARNGNFTAISLTDNGIAGNFYVNEGGSITLGNYGSNPQLKGNITMTGGTFNIIAAIESQWPGNGNASITMSDGELNVYPYGIEIVDNPPYTFTSNITGGSIRTEGAFINHRSDFNPTAGTIELYGNQNAALSMSAGSLYKLIINKENSNSVILSTNLTLGGGFTVDEGTLNLNAKTLSTGKECKVYDGGVLDLNAGSSLLIKASYWLNVYSGGLLKAIGTAGNPVLISRIGSANYIYINIYPGGNISARNTQFHYLNPLRIITGGIIDPDNPLSDCQFRYCETGMLWVENGQTLLIRNTEFLSPASGYNVYKSADSGSLQFVDFYGDFAGAAFENDPYNRINWGDEFITHNISLPAGWSGLSSSVIPNQPAMENVFAPISDELIIAQTMAQMYYPGQNVNTIGNWVSQSAYKVKTSAACTLPVTGEYESDLTVSLNAGWNLLPVVSPVGVDANDLFSLVDALVIAKDVAGTGVYWPEHGINTLQVVEPGKAYFVLLTEADEVDFAEHETNSEKTLSGKTPSNFRQLVETTDPASGDQINKNNLSDNSAVRSSVAALRVGTPLSLRREAGGEVSPCVGTPSPGGEGWGEVIKTPLTHTIAFPRFVTTDFDEGSIITIYNQFGMLCGATLFQNQNLALTAFGDDPTTPAIDGMTEGDPMHFRVFNPATGKEFPIEVLFDETMPQGGSFVNHGLSAIKSMETTEIGERSATDISVSIYPNPSKGIFQVSTLSGFGTLTGFEWETTDMHGSTIARGKSQSNDFTIDLTGHKPGIYFIKIQQNGKSLFRKIVLK